MCLHDAKRFTRIQTSVESVELAPCYTWGNRACERFKYLTLGHTGCTPVRPDIQTWTSPRCGFVLFCSVLEATFSFGGNFRWTERWYL